SSYIRGRTRRSGVSARCNDPRWSSCDARALRHALYVRMVCDIRIGICSILASFGTQASALAARPNERNVMPRIIRCALIQATCTTPTEEPLEKIKRDAIEKHLKLMEEAAAKGAKILCLQEIFTGPYFCAEQSARWYGMVEKIPDGPTIQMMREIA